MTPDINWSEILQKLLDFTIQNVVGILLSIGIILAVGRVVVFIARRIVRDDEKLIAFQKWARYITAIFLVLWIVILYNSYSRNDTPFYLVIIGLVLAAVAISLRDVISNLAGWLVILSSKGFKNGDRIKIGNVKGDVIDIGLLRTVLAEIGDWVAAEQSTGRLVSIPNSMILTHEVMNYTQGHDFIWHELTFLITFESNWEKAERIVTEIANREFEQSKEQIRERLKKVRRQFLLRYNYISPKAYIRIADSGIELALRYMVRARRRRNVEDALSREILERFGRESDIDFAYPTVRIYRQGERGGGEPPRGRYSGSV